MYDVWCSGSDGALGGGVCCAAPVAHKDGRARRAKRLRLVAPGSKVRVHQPPLRRRWSPSRVRCLSALHDTRVFVNATELIEQGFENGRSDESSGRQNGERRLGELCWGTEHVGVPGHPPACAYTFAVLGCAVLGGTAEARGREREARRGLGWTEQHRTNVGCTPV